MVRHAYIEAYLQQLVYLVADIDPMIGRAAFREPRSPDRLGLIEDICDARGIRWDEDARIFFKAFKADLRQATEIRDQLAHSRWHYDEEEDQWGTENLRGKHPNNDPRQGPTGKKRLRPEALVWDAPTLELVVNALEMLIGKLTELNQTIVDILEKASAKS